MSSPEPSKFASIAGGERAATQAQTPESHRLIALLLAGTIERIRLAQDCHRRGDLPGRARALFAAATSVEGLRLSLDHDAGGEIAAGLETLYLHTTAHLVAAGQGDAGALEQAQSLLQNIASAWAAIVPGQTKPSPPVRNLHTHDRSTNVSHVSRPVREDPP